MAKFKTEGLDDLIEELDGMRNRSKKLGSSCTAFQVLTPAFMKRHTKYKDFQSFMAAGGFNVNCDDDLRKLDADAVDIYIAKSTEYQNFEDMFSNAASDFIMYP